MNNGFLAALGITTELGLHAKRLGGCVEGGLESVGGPDAALGDVFAAAAASIEYRHRLFHQSTHVEGLAGGLSEDHRRLRRCRGKQHEYIVREARQLLRQQFQRIHIAFGEGPDDEAAAIRFGSFSEQGRGLRDGEFFLSLLALLAEGANFVERFTGLLRDVVDVGREKSGGVGERGEVATGRGDGALSGNEFDTPSLTNSFGFAEKDAADLSSLIDVRASASA